MDLCMIFPGIGYSCDKPLLYWAAKLAANSGYEVRRYSYADLNKDIRDNEEKMQAAVAKAIVQTEEKLDKEQLKSYDRILLIGKSIGTVVSLAVRESFELNARAVLMTPLEKTFSYNAADCIAFHGTADPWANTERIEELCRNANVPLFEYRDANHSLETGDVLRDMENIRDVIARTADHIMVI
ncbi:MAG: alpha/beta hydrolase [Ruminococcus sp.]|nr:alpha/beta hydrolase [Ruminococcus sp.]